MRSTCSLVEIYNKQFFSRLPILEYFKSKLLSLFLFLLLDELPFKSDTHFNPSPHPHFDSSPGNTDSLRVHRAPALSFPTLSCPPHFPPLPQVILSLRIHRAPALSFPTLSCPPHFPPLPQVILTAYESTEHLPAPDGDDGDGTGLQWDRSEPNELSSASLFGAAAAATAAGGAKAASDASGGWGAAAAGAKGHPHQNRVTPEPSAADPAAAGLVDEGVNVMPTILRSTSNSRAPPALA